MERITRHDLKTPLNGIINFPRLIRMGGNLSKKQLLYLDMIESSGLAMLNMINLSLDLFNMEKGVYKFQPAQINILEIMKKSITEIQSLPETNGIFINIMINGVPADKADSFLVKGEELLCYSMLSNLIKNACEASPKHETVTISCNYVQDKAYISIHNMGAVPENIQNNFFDKYVTSGKKSGTGLGTYSAKLIAETQGGSISFDTSEEKGTTVTICLQTQPSTSASGS